MRGRPGLTVAAAAATLCAAGSLGALISGWSWLWPVAGGIAVTALGSWAARAIRAAAVAPLAAAGLVLVFVTAVDASAHALAGFIPTGASMHALGQLIRQGFTEISHKAPPVPAHRGLVLIAVIGVAAAALVIDLFTVTIGRPAMAGLPMLALFALPASLARHGVGWWRFALAGFGWLVLLYADGRHRLSGWGQVLGRGERSAAMPSPLASVGRRIGLATLAVATVVPLLVPGVSARAFGRGGGGGDGKGPATVTTINPIIRIRDQLHQRRATPVLTVHTDDPSPDYLRLTALDTFDGNQWTLSSVSAGPQSQVRRGLPAPEGADAVSLTTVTDSIQIDGLAVHWLPVPYTPLHVSVPGDWRYDVASQTIFSARTDTRGLSYSLSDARLQPTPEELRTTPASTGLQRYLQLPRGLAPEVRRTALRVTNAGRTEYDKALLLQQFFQSPPFVYDESVPQGDGTSAIVAFLRNHRGFCEQYAATMAVLARVVGIPARVAVGFTPGQRLPGGRYVVTTRDAHAWPELYFAGIGWLRFEPTPRSDGQAQIPSYAVPATGGAASHAHPAAPQPKPKRATNPSGLHDKALRFNGTPGGTAAARSGHHRSLAALWIALAALAGVLLGFPASLRLVSRFRRWSAARDAVALTRAAWLDVTDEATDAGHLLPAGDTPRHAADRLAATARLSPTGQAALSRLARWEERSRYAASGPQVTRDELRRDVAAVRTDLWRDARVRQVAARAFPRSSLRRTVAALEIVPAAVDRLDRLVSAASGWLRMRARRVG